MSKKKHAHKKVHHKGHSPSLGQGKKSLLTDIASVSEYSPKFATGGHDALYTVTETNADGVAIEPIYVQMPPADPTAPIQFNERILTRHAEDGTPLELHWEKPHTGDPRFHAFLKRMADIHDSKQNDYGDAKKRDPFANLRASEEVGVEAWRGALVRGGDKWQRIKNAASGVELKHESMVNSLLDFANYLIICAVLYEEIYGEQAIS